MSKHHLPLTDDEKSLLARIDLREYIPHGEDAHAIFLANCEPILALLKSLSDRDAIPKHRVAYWIDPALNTGRSKSSHRDLFAKNGSGGQDTYTHPHFKPYLRYFLFGADLPTGAISEFEAQIGNPKWFSGSDILGLTKKTRAIVRTYALKDGRYAEEFFRLALDNGLDRYQAASVRKAAVEAARR